MFDYSGVTVQRVNHLCKKRIVIINEDGRICSELCCLKISFIHLTAISLLPCISKINCKHITRFKLQYQAYNNLFTSYLMPMMYSYQHIQSEQSACSSSSRGCELRKHYQYIISRVHKGERNVPNVFVGRCIIAHFGFIFCRKLSVMYIECIYLYVCRL